MPAQRPRASFEPLSPHFDPKKLVESTQNFQYVDRISCDMIDEQGLPAFEKLITLHVIVGGKPLVIDGFEDRLDPWTFTPRWLRDNCGDKVEQATNLTTREKLPLTLGHYLRNMGLLTQQFFDKPQAWKEKNRQRMYLKDIDCPTVWWDKVKEHIPNILNYLNDATGNRTSSATRAGDLMSSLPSDMRAENLMCYIGHEGTYTPAHREMCASLGHNIMVEASSSASISENGNVEKQGSSIWFMTESKERHLVSEYWLSVLGHDIEVEDHFAQVAAWKKAPFSVYVVEQRPGDLILIPPLAPHQVWNRGTRTMKVAWNRTTVETLEMAINEALPRSRIVCRDEQYKNKAIVYYTLQKYSGLLGQAQAGSFRQLFKDFKRLFNLYRQMLLSEMFNPEEREAPKNIEYIPFDSNITCAYCRGNIFNRFLSCTSCQDLLGHNAHDGEGDPYDICLDCYAMGRSCACISNLKWVEQFRWKELASKYEAWRRLIIAIEDGDKSLLPLLEERKRYGKKTLAEVCKEQLKRRPWKDVHKPSKEEDENENDTDEEIVVGDDGMVKKVTKKRSKAWLKNNTPCHVCCHRHPSWRMASCTTCDRAWCYGSLFRGWDKMPIQIMEVNDWECPHCLGICFAGACRREGKMVPYEPQGTLLGHNTKRVADVRSVEALVDFSVSNLSWLKEDSTTETGSRRLNKAKADAEKSKANDSLDHEDSDGVNVEEEASTQYDEGAIDPALTDASRQHDMDGTADLASQLQQVNSVLPSPAAMVAGAPRVPDGYAPVSTAGYISQSMPIYGDPSTSHPYEYPRPMSVQPVGDDDTPEPPFASFKRRERDDDEDIAMTKSARIKKPKLSAAGFKSSDLADGAMLSSAKTEAQRQFEKEKERKTLELAKSQGRFIMTQAALKRKRRLVKLKISHTHLAQILAQQATELADFRAAEGEDEDPSAQQLHEEAMADDTLHLLTSDIAPKKIKDQKLYQKQREQSGHIITSKTKKALIPIERDDNYGYYPRERTTGTKKAGQGGKRKSRQHIIQYEEVDVGSDNDENDDGSLIARGINTQDHGKRRSLPAYLRNRVDEYEDDVLASLPVDFRDHAPRSKRSGGASRTSDTATAASTSRTNHQPSRTAGKRPSTRPTFSTTLNGPTRQEDSDDDGADGDVVASASVPPEPSASTAYPLQSANESVASRGRGRPPKTLSNGPKSSQQESIDKDNRLAKLQSLHMVENDDELMTEGTPQHQSIFDNKEGKRVRIAQRPSAISIAGLDDDEDDESDESDDGVDSVPARRAVPI